MTREEADFIGGMNMCDEISNEAYRKIMCYCEEQEPCEYCISREAVLIELDKYLCGVPFAINFCIKHISFSSATIFLISL